MRSVAPPTLVASQIKGKWVLKLIFHYGIINDYIMYTDTKLKPMGVVIFKSVYKPEHFTRVKSYNRTIGCSTKPSLTTCN